MTLALAYSQTHVPPKWGLSPLSPRNQELLLLVANALLEGKQLTFVQMSKLMKLKSKQSVHLYFDVVATGGWIVRAYDNECGVKMSGYCLSDKAWEYLRLGGQDPLALECARLRDEVAALKKQLAALITFAGGDVA